MRTSPFFLLCCALLFAGGCDNPDQHANGLFVTASNDATLAVAEPDVLKKHQLLSSAQKAVNEIVADYPSTNAAVRIAANEPIGPYTRAQLDDALAKLGGRPELCIPNLSRACLVQALAADVANFYANPPKEDPRPAAMRAATNLSVLHLLDPARAASLTPTDPKLKGAQGYLLEQGYSSRDTFVPLFSALSATPKTDAAAEMAKAITGIPVATQPHLRLLTSAVYKYPPEPRTATTFKDVLRLATLIQSPLPADAVQSITLAFCNLPYFPKPDTVARILADCTPAQLALGNNFPPLSNDQFEAIYAAADSAEKKKSIASSAYGKKGATVDDQLLWAERGGYNRIDLLTSLYERAVREQHPSLSRVVALIEKTPQPDSTSPIATSGVTTKNLMLLHASGQLAGNLPAIFQVLRANPGYSDELAVALTGLLGLAHADASIPLEPIVDTLAATAKTWDSSKDSSREYVLSPLFRLIEKRDLDPKPLYDRYYGNEAYLGTLDYDTLVYFKKHGHPAPLDQLLANAPPIDAERSPLFFVLLDELKASASAGDGATIVSKVANLEPRTRSSVFRSLFNTKFGTLNEGTARALPAVLAAYPAELVATEINWNEDYNIPDQAKAVICADHFAEISSRSERPPSGWLLLHAVQLPNDVRLKAIQALHAAGDTHWAVLAAVHVMLTEPAT